jgi:hypothetical protein
VLHLTSVIVHQAAIGLSWKLFFRLCFDYWKGVYVCYRVFASIVPAHLSIALQAGHHGKKARLLNHEFLAVGIHQRVADEVLTDSSVDFHKAIRKGTGAKMDELAGKFEQLVLLGVTQGFDDVRSDLEASEDLFGVPRPRSTRSDRWANLVARGSPGYILGARKPLVTSRQDL